MFKNKVFTDKFISKFIYSSLFVLLLHLFIDTRIQYIQAGSFFTKEGSLLQALIIIIIFFAIKQLFKSKGLKTASIVLLSTVLVINITFLIVSNLEVNEEIAEIEEDIEEIIQDEELSENLINDSQEVQKKSTNNGDGHTNRSSQSNSLFIDKYSWIINFVLLALAIVGVYKLLQKKKETPEVVYQTTIEENMDNQTIQIDELTHETYEEGVYVIYRQLCDVAKQRNGLTRRKSMTSTEYGALLIKLGFPEVDILEIIESFEVLRYGHINLSDDHIVRLNNALKNINTAMNKDD
ncbi:MAG: DUF4129 domain-containing protein [Saccharospirillaceae bacterium]|nr:DUF4129 domain-containing protein [Pseudomonadales bacterium]NRB79970.1 DUF4129 domain-containing protein [Saccharospirillaceae bacterium]